MAKDLIDAEAAAELLAAVLPGSDAAREEMLAWPRYLDEYEGPYERDRLRWLGSYVDALAHHVGKTFVPGEVGYLPELFAAIELVLAEGDPAAQRLVRTGMLNWLSIVYAPRDYFPGSERLHDEMAAWLGPVSQEWWDTFARQRREIEEAFRNVTVTEDGRYVIGDPREREDA